MNLNEARDVVERALDQKVPVMLKGPPGVGKSDMVSQIADDRAIQEINMKLSQIEPTEIAGVPVPKRFTVNDFVEVLAKMDLNGEYGDLSEQAERIMEEEEGRKTLEWYRPEWLPSKDEAPDSEGIIFLDELNQAKGMQQAAAWELILERRLGELEIPDGWGIIAAGNRAEDRAQINPMPDPLKNRMIHVEVESSFEVWRDWATGRGDIEEAILAFLNFRKELLFKQIDGNDSFPTPRTWEYASDMYDENADAKLRRAFVESAVGESAAKEFNQWEEVYQDIDPDKLLDDEFNIEEKEPSFQYAAVAAISQYAKNHKKTQDFIDDLAHFTAGLSKEFQVLFVKSIVNNTKLWKKLREREVFERATADIMDLVIDV